MGKKLEHHLGRFEQFKALLLQHPKGLRKAEIARRMGIDRSTAGDYVVDFALPNGPLPIIEIAPDHFTIDRDLFEISISLNQHEALALHLATRLLTTRTDKHYPHAASALRKLSEAIGQLSPEVSRHIRRSADIIDGNTRRRDPRFLEILETLTRAWTLGQKVELTYEKANGEVREYVYSPYFVEPYSQGRSMHVLGKCEQNDELRTLKIERVCTIKLLGERYVVDKGFNAESQLANAWGIWYTDDEPVDVVLRFDGRVAKRVKENQWHHNEEITEDEVTGVLIWKATVDDWREMRPWIRGWGADVIVLEPAELRAELKAESERLARNYGLID